MSRPRAKPRVAVDARPLVGPADGIGRYTESLLKTLAPRRRHDYLAIAHRPPRGADELAAAGIEVETRRAPLGVLFQQLTLPRRLAGGDVDLLWSPLNVLPARLPVPAVVTVHDLTPVLMPEHHRLKVRWSMLPFLERTLSGAARIVADSRSTESDLHRLFPWCAERVEVVYPGVDGSFRPAPAERIAEIRQGLDCPHGYLLAVGTLDPRKNLELLVDVWEELRAVDEEVPPLVVAGGYGWRSRRLERRLSAPTDPDLRWLGHVDAQRLVELYQAASAFVFPSLYEGFGLPPAEAMACGVPVVVSDRASLPEVVGDAGLTFDPERPEELAHQLRRLLRDAALATELGERGRQRAARFSWESAADGLEAVFEAALQ